MLRGHYGLLNGLLCLRGFFLMISSSFLYLNVLLEKLQTFPIKYIYTPAEWKKYTPVCFSVIIWIIIIIFWWCFCISQK